MAGHGREEGRSLKREVMWPAARQTDGHTDLSHQESSSSRMGPFARQTDAVAAPPVILFITFLPKPSLPSFCSLQYTFCDFGIIQR